MQKEPFQILKRGKKTNTRITTQNLQQVYKTYVEEKFYTLIICKGQKPNRKVRETK